MRLLALTLLALTACGPDAPPTPDVTGNWLVTLDQAHCRLSLSGPPERLEGLLACGTMTDSVSGRVTLDTLDLTFTAPEFDPFTMTGTGDGTTLTGRLYGSGYQGEAFLGHRP